MSERSDFRDFTKILYDVISAREGERHWPSSRQLFHSDARMVRTGIDDTGESFARVMSVSEYEANAEQLLEGATFSEVEIRHDAIVFGNVGQASSVYEFCWQSGGAERRGRGVNFFTFIQVDGHWQIMSIVWDNERDGLTLAAVGLTKD